MDRLRTVGKIIEISIQLNMLIKNQQGSWQRYHFRTVFLKTKFFYIQGESVRLYVRPYQTARFNIKFTFKSFINLIIYIFYGNLKNFVFGTFCWFKIGLWNKTKPALYCIIYIFLNKKIRSIFIFIFQSAVNSPCIIIVKVLTLTRSV